jgi:hypothetical protein
VGKVPATITYSTLDGCNQPVTHAVDCPQGCAFVSPSVAQCNASTGALPARTCAADNDCQGTHYCADPTHARLLDGPHCADGLCDWQQQTDETCLSQCDESSGSCHVQGPVGGTSGGFPWAGMAATCENGTVTSFTGHGAGGGYDTVTHPCQKDCFADATGVGCDQITGEPPYHSCLKATDCPAASQCLADDPTSVTEWLQPTCNLGFCQWTGTIKKACPAGTICQATTCAPGQGGGGGSGGGG